MWENENGTYITEILQLTSGKEKDYILEVNIPKSSRECTDAERNLSLACVEAEMYDLQGLKYSLKSELKVSIINETEDSEESPEDKSVMTNFYRVRGAEVLTQAKNLADARKYDDAQKLLKNFKEELGGCIVKNEQFVQNLIKDIDQAVEDTKPQVYEERGKHNMIGNARAQMQQKAYMQSANVYSNDIQQEMVSKTKAKKALF